MNDPLLSALINALVTGHVDQALELEAICFLRLVKPIEDEDHYFRMFEIWRAGFERLGEARRGKVAQGDTVGFVLHSDSPMAHAQIAIEHCRLRPAGAKACVFVLSHGTNQLASLLRPMGVKVYYLARERDGVSVMVERMREIAIHAGVGTLVWVSLPLYSSYAFAARVAARQVFWSQRFHPIKSRHIDLYICPGKRSELTRIFHGQEWQVRHTPLAIPVSGVAEKRQLKLTPADVRLGTIGRDEKIANPMFLDTVRRLLQAIPGVLFAFTGREPQPATWEALRPFKTQFVGWVDPETFIGALTVYIETIPVGGLSTLIAWDLGVPAVGLDNVHSPYGSIEYDGIASAKTLEQYREMVLELCQSQGARNRVVAAQKLALEAERARAEEDVGAWWELVRS